MLSPSPSAGIKWGNDYEVLSLCFSPLCNLIVSLRPCSERKRMGLGWIHLFAGGVPRASLSPVFSLVLQLCQPWATNEMLWEPHQTYLGSLLHLQSKAVHITYTETSTLSKIALLCEGLLGKEMSREFSTSSFLLSDTHSGFWPPWWSRLSACWTDSLFRFWSYSEFSLILMYVFYFFSFLFIFLNLSLWKGKGFFLTMKHLSYIN